MQKLRIGILGTRGIPNHYGGFEQFAEYLSLGLAQRGHEVYVYNSKRHPYQEKQWRGVNIIHCKDPEGKLGTFGQFIYDLNCINDSRKRNFDVLLHLGYTSDSIWHWRWPKQTVNMVNIDGLEWMRSKYNRTTRYFLKYAEALAARNAQVLIADSPQMQVHFQNRYGKKPVYIPYGAEIFKRLDDSVPASFHVSPHQYYLLIARMEPENNIEMIMRGFMESSQSFPLLVVGNTGNRFGKYLSRHFHNRRILFTGSVYDQFQLNNLRYFSARYFHGHSVGGTNPSLLEAMACGCNIAAHNNIFNKTVLQNGADYFSTEHEVSQIMNAPFDTLTLNQRKQLNIERIRNIYNIEKNIDDYESLMLEVCNSRSVTVKTTPAGLIAPSQPPAVH